MVYEGDVVKKYVTLYRYEPTMEKLSIMLDIEVPISATEIVGDTNRKIVHVLCEDHIVTLDYDAYSSDGKNNVSCSILFVPRVNGKVDESADTNDVEKKLIRTSHGGYSIISHTTLSIGNNSIILLVNELGCLFHLYQDGKHLGYLGSIGADAFECEAMCLQQPGYLVMFGRSGVKVFLVGDCEGELTKVDSIGIDVDECPTYFSNHVNDNMTFIEPVQIKKDDGNIAISEEEDKEEEGTQQTRESSILEVWSKASIPHPILDITTVLPRGCLRSYIVATHMKGVSVLQRGREVTKLGSLDLFGCPDCRLFKLGHYDPPIDYKYPHPVTDEEGNVQGEFEQFLLVSVPQQNKTLAVSCSITVAPVKDDEKVPFVMDEETIFACDTRLGFYIQITPTRILSISYFNDARSPLNEFHLQGEKILFGGYEEGNIFIITNMYELVHLVVGRNAAIPREVSRIGFSGEASCFIVSKCVGNGGNGKVLAFVGFRDGSISVFENIDGVLEQCIRRTKERKTDDEYGDSIVSICPLNIEESETCAILVCCKNGTVLPFLLLEDGNEEEMMKGKLRSRLWFLKNQSMFVGVGDVQLISTKGHVLASSISSSSFIETHVLEKQNEVSFSSRPIAIKGSLGMLCVEVIDSPEKCVNIVSIEEGEEGKVLSFYQIDDISGSFPQDGNMEIECSSICEYQTEHPVRRIIRLPSRNTSEVPFLLLERGEVGGDRIHGGKITQISVISIITIDKNGKIVQCQRVKLQEGISVVDACCLIPPRKKREKPVEYMIIGVIDSNHSCSFLYTYLVNHVKSFPTLSAVNATPVEGTITALSGDIEHVAVGVSRSLFMYKLNTKRLLKVACYDAFTSPIVKLIVNKEMVFVGTLDHSVSMFIHRSKVNLLTLEVDDALPCWVSAMQLVDENTLVVGDKFGCVFTLSIPEVTRKTLALQNLDGFMNMKERLELLEKCGITGEMKPVNDILQKFDRLCWCDVEDVPTSFSVSPLGVGQEPVIIYSTSSGALRGLVQITQKSEAQRLRDETEPKQTGIGYWCNVVDGDNILFFENNEYLRTALVKNLW